MGGNVSVLENGLEVQIILTNWRCSLKKSEKKTNMMLMRLGKCRFLIKNNQPHKHVMENCWFSNTSAGQNIGVVTALKLNIFCWRTKKEKENVTYHSGVTIQNCILWKTHGIILLLQSAALLTWSQAVVDSVWDQEMTCPSTGVVLPCHFISAQVYADYESNPQLRQAIEFACRQFYVLHRKPFILQLFASVAPLLEFPVSKSIP